MRAVRHHDVARFRARVEPLLVGKEAENNLILGLLRSSAAPTAVLFDVEDDDGVVVAAALQTPPHNLVIADAPPAALDALVAALDAETLSIPGVVGPKLAARHLADVWARRHAVPLHKSHQMRVFECRQLVAPRPPVDGGGARPALEADLPLVHAWSHAFARDTGTTVPPTPALVEERVRSGGFLLWETDRPVAMAAVARRTPNGVAVGYVYTPDALRGRGYASAITAALTDRERRAGRRCFLFTDVANPTSNKIYQAIGYVEVCEVEEWRFE